MTRIYSPIYIICVCVLDLPYKIIESRNTLVTMNLYTLVLNNSLSFVSKVFQGTGNYLIYTVESTKWLTRAGCFHSYKCQKHLGSKYHYGKFSKNWLLAAIQIKKPFGAKETMEHKPGVMQMLGHRSLTIIHKELGTCGYTNTNSKFMFKNGK